MKNYQETLDYLYSMLPMYQRVGSIAFKKDLTNTKTLLKALQNPEQKFKSIHIAGTNGKGSVSHMLAAVFQAAGYKTGLYTSPHLKDFRERIKVNGDMISEADVIEFTHKMASEIEKITPSFFELTVAMAFEYFQKQKVDIAIIETGLGGRLDSTNVILPEMSVITNIDFDHMDMLGDTLELIAVEKAGIIKPDVPVIIGQHDKITAPVFLNTANNKRARIKFADQFFKAELHTRKGAEMEVNIYKNEKPFLSELHLDLNGIYQLKNVCTSICTLEELKNIGWDFPDEAVRIGLGAVKSLTGLRGRWDVINLDPLIIADTGHNEAGIKEILQTLNNISYKKLHFILGLAKEKDSSKILSLLPKDAEYYFTKAQIPRALNELELAEKAAQFDLKGRTYSSVNEAIEAAKANYQSGDLIFVGGSNFVVAEAI